MTKAKFNYVLHKCKCLHLPIRKNCKSEHTDTPPHKHLCTFQSKSNVWAQQEWLECSASNRQCRITKIKTFHKQNQLSSTAHLVHDPQNSSLITRRNTETLLKHTEMVLGKPKLASVCIWWGTWRATRKASTSMSIGRLGKIRACCWMGKGPSDKGNGKSQGTQCLLHFVFTANRNARTLRAVEKSDDEDPVAEHLNKLDIYKGLIDCIQQVLRELAKIIARCLSITFESPW